MSRGRLIAAVRERMQSRSAVSDAEDRARPARPVADKPPRPAEPDHRLDQLAAEEQYHRNRFELYHARVISGSERATTPARLRELERTATAATERLAHARRSGRGAA